METLVQERKRQRKGSDSESDDLTEEASNKPTRGASISRMLRGDAFPEACPPVVNVFPLEDVYDPPLCDFNGNGNSNADGNAEKQQHQHCILRDDHEKVVVTVLPGNSNSRQSF